MKDPKDRPRAEPFETDPEMTDGLRDLLEQMRREEPPENYIEHLAQRFESGAIAPSSTEHGTHTGGADTLGWVSIACVLGGIALGVTAWKSTHAPLSRSVVPSPTRAPTGPPSPPDAPQEEDTFTEVPQTSLDLPLNQESEPESAKSTTRHAARTAPKKAPSSQPSPGEEAPPEKAPPPAGSAADLLSESRILASARASLQSSPARALAIAEEHARRYPNGALVQEREVIAINALARMGKKQAARARAEKLLEEHPQTAHRRTLERLLSK